MTDYSAIASDESTPILASAHSADTAELLIKLGSQGQGLSTTEAAQRLDRWGPNQLASAAPTPAWRRWLRQFHNLFIYVLLLSGAISASIGHWLDSGVIVAVVLINATIGFLQEGKAERALRSIMSMSRSQCLVVRDGQTRQIDIADLVPGDVVVLQPGDRVPADLRLLDTKNLRCDEALLTGESQASDKDPAPVAEHAPLAERTSMAYMGTLVASGNGRGLVIHTGAHTEIGAINRLVQGVELVETPLQRQLRVFAGQLTVAILLLTALTVALGFFLHGSDPAELFRGAIGIAVAAIPEGLPAIVTITLALGVERMARQHALVRRLPAVEVLGAVNVICSDKTGTLTANAMTARAVVTRHGSYSVSGEGYAPNGTLSCDSGSIQGDAILQTACRIALLCNDANVIHEDGEWHLHGDPTEGALHVLARKHGLSTQDVEAQWPRLDTLPFETEKRYMATLHPSTSGEREIAIKGAPDRLIGLCQRQLGTDGPEPLDRDYWHEQIEALALRGMRVMALAHKPVSDQQQDVTHTHMEGGLVMIALVGISDPPRPEAVEAIAQCHRAGIRVLMITGDNPVTAAAIGRELGLNAGRVMTGAELDELSPEQRLEAASSVDIFARTSPLNKLQLVQALQASEHTVAMTGDGVNDAPALRSADIGVAMGHKGTDAAKEAAAFVLTDDNFATIVSAVSEGRTIYDNIVKAIVFILPTNVAQASVIILAMLFSWVLPITPPQILWVNMVTAVTLALAIGFERSEANVMLRPPRPYSQRLISLNLLYRTLLVGAVGAATVFALFNWRDQVVSTEQARSLAVNALVLFQIFYLLSARTLNDALWHKRYWQGITPTACASVIVLMLQLAFTYWAPSQRIFEIAPLPAADWLLLAAATSPILFIMELEKAWARYRSRKTRTPPSVQRRG